MNELFGPLSAETLRLLNAVPALIDRTFPLPGRFRSGLAGDVAELSRLMTADRGERDPAYLSRPGHLSAYLRYFLPWNIFRLCRLLPNLELSLSPGDVILDLGCGPLSLAAALWISLPDLRKLPLELRCVDRTPAVLEAGRKFFDALAGPDCPWKIITIRGNINPAGTINIGAGKKSGTKLHAGYAPGGEKPHTEHCGRYAPFRGKAAALVCAVNVFNEIYRKVSPNDREGVKRAAACAARLLDSCADASASILAVEPGVPFSGEFISCLRDALIEKGRPPRAPCPHSEACPVPGGGSGTGKKRWCHFAFDTGEAPAALRRLSVAAGIPKERAVLSFLHAGHRQIARNKTLGETGPAQRNREALTRVISDAFPLPDGTFGRYCCSARGLILAAGKRADVEACASGSLINVVVDANGERDRKSGALLARILS